MKQCWHTYQFAEGKGFDTSGLVAIVSVIVLIGGCGNSDSIKPENIHSYTHKNIIVQLKNDSMIQFTAGDYSSNLTTEGKVIAGKGRYLSSGDSMGVEFDGVIPVADIKKIHIPDQLNNNTDTHLNILLVSGVVISLFVFAINGIEMH